VSHHLLSSADSARGQHESNGAARYTTSSKTVTTAPRLEPWQPQPRSWIGSTGTLGEVPVENSATTQWHFPCWDTTR